MMNTTDTRRRLFLGTAMVLLQTLFWGIGNPMLKYALSVMPLYWCLTLRFIPTALLALLIFRPKLGVIFGDKKTLASCTLLSVFTAAAYIFANLGLKYTSATMAGFLMSIAVLFTPFVSWLLYRKKPRFTALVPVLIVTAGMFLIGFDGSAITLGIGDLFAVVSSLASALVYALSVKLLEDVPPITLTVFQTGFCGLTTLIFALLTENAALVLQAPTNSYLVIAYLVIFATLIAYILQNYALRLVSEVYASLMYCAEPVFTAAASFVILQERLNVYGWCGSAVILAGMVLATWWSSRE